jgi:hypothetical protein
MLMFTPEFLALLATGVAVVIGATQAVKKWLGLHGWPVVVLSFFISGGAVLFHYMRDGFTLIEGCFLWLAVWLQANGWYIFRNGRR